MHLDDIRDYVVRPVLQSVGLLDLARVQLVVGTGLEESRYNYLDQTTPGPGPAYGFWQMEKFTHDDLWDTYLTYQPSALRDAVLVAAGHGTRARPDVTVLHWNLRYAALMCALKYRRVRAALPAAGDAVAMAGYWKQWYNTPLGKGSAEKAVESFKRACE